MMQSHFVIKTRRGDIVIRPQRKDEDSVYGVQRFAIIQRSGHALLLMVRKTGCPEMKQATLAAPIAPEKKWKRCLHCGKTDWSAWLPVQLAWCDAPDGIPGPEYPYVQWLVICIHCFGVVDLRISGPYAEDEGEYFFDNTKEPTHLILPGWQNNRER